MPRRKNKQTRKYMPRNEFRYNNSPSGKGHPNYVFGETDNNYKSLSVTHSPNAKYRNVPLHKNPDLSDTRISYIELKPKTAQKRYYSDPLEGWELIKIDMSIVRYTTKKYKKSTNRHKKRK